MPVATPISAEEYLNTSYEPDCDFIDGQLLERHVGKRKHSYTQTFLAHYALTHWPDELVAFVEHRLRVTPNRYRVPDVVILQLPVVDEDVITSAPYICVEVLSPEDTVSRLQERLDDYLGIGVSNIWVIDPLARRAWTISRAGWNEVQDGFLRTIDLAFEIPLSKVFTPNA